MSRLTAVALGGLLALVALPSHACRFNTDCEVGSKCVKEAGKIEGMCMAGMNPGNDNDRSPYRNVLDITGSEGNTCSFNTDCGVGAKCAKESGRLQGVCVRR